MSILDLACARAPRPPSPSRSRPDRVSAASLEWRGGQPVVAAHASSRCRRRAGAVADRGQHRTIAPRWSAALDARARAGRPAAPHRPGRPRRRRQGVAGPVRAGAGRDAGSRSAGALAGAQERRRSRSRRRRSATCPGCSAADGQEFVVSLARRERHRRNTKRCAPKPARTPASSTSRRFNVINAVLAGARRAGGRLAAGERRRRLRVDRAAARPAPDLLPQPRRRHRRHARRSRAPDGDVLRGSAEGRRLRARAAGRRGGGRRASGRRRRRSCGAASRIGCGRRSRPSIRATAAALTDRIAAAPALLDTLAPLVGLLLRDRARGARRDPHQPLDAAVLQRARGPPLAARAAPLVVAAATLFNVSRVARATRAATRELATQASRDEARAADLRRQAARLRAQRRSAADRLRRRRRAPGQRPDRSPDVLVDRAVQPLRDDAARRRADRVGAAARRPRARHRPHHQRRRRGPSTTSTTFIENLEATGAFSNVRPAEEHIDEEGLLVSSLEASTCRRPGSRRVRGGGATR